MNVNERPYDEVANGLAGRNVWDYKPEDFPSAFTKEKLQEKPSNPKDIVGSDKLPLHLWPETATVLGCLGMLEGALKYGRSNFRAVGVKSSIYVDAAKRHLNKWFEGQDIDPDSGLPELGKALACIAIIIDAQAAGKLNDDRMVRGGYAKLVEEMTPHVARLKKQYAIKSF